MLLSWHGLQGHLRTSHWLPAQPMGQMQRSALHAPPFRHRSPPQLAFKFGHSSNALPWTASFIMFNRRPSIFHVDIQSILASIIQLLVVLIENTYLQAVDTSGHARQEEEFGWRRCTRRPTTNVKPLRPSKLIIVDYFLLSIHRIRIVQFDGAHAKAGG